MIRRLAGVALAALLALAAPAPRPAAADVADLDALAIVTDTALARVAQALLPLRFNVDGSAVVLDGVALCPAIDEHDVELVGFASPDGSAAVALPANACDTPLAALATAAGAASGAAAWHAAVRVRVTWSEDMLRGAVTDAAIAAAAPPPVAPVPAGTAGGVANAAGAAAPTGPAAARVPDAQRLRAVLTAAPLFTIDTRKLIALDFSGKRFELAAVPKFEAHRVVVELMRDVREAGDRAGWEALENDTSAAVPAGSDAVIAGTHPFIGRALGEAFAAPVEVYRTQDHVITVHDVREAGTTGDVRASGEAVDTVSGTSGTIFGEYQGTTDLTLRKIDVVAHEKTCTFVDLGCVTNNIGLRIGSGVLARQLLSRYGNSPLRPAQPLGFPLALEGRTIVLTVEAIQTRSSAEALRIAGRLGVTSH